MRAGINIPMSLMLASANTARHIRITTNILSTPRCQSVLYCKNMNRIMQLLAHATSYYQIIVQKRAKMNFYKQLNQQLGIRLYPQFSNYTTQHAKSHKPARNMQPQRKMISSLITNKIHTHTLYNLVFRLVIGPSQHARLKTLIRLKVKRVPLKVRVRFKLNIKDIAQIIQNCLPESSHAKRQGTRFS